jgi:hypothetical protein
MKFLKKNPNNRFSLIPISPIKKLIDENEALHDMYYDEIEGLLTFHLNFEYDSYFEYEIKILSWENDVKLTYIVEYQTDFQNFPKEINTLSEFTKMLKDIKEHYNKKLKESA